MSSYLLMDALVIASEAHKGVMRKWVNEPYINHPIRVAHAAFELSGYDVVGAAALCHDCVEDNPNDAGYWSDRIRNECGEKVLGLVLELTWATENKNIPRKERQEIRLRHMKDMSNQAKLVKMVDRWDNLLHYKMCPAGWLKMYLGESQGLVEACKMANGAAAKLLLDRIQEASLFLVEAERN